MPLPKTKHPLFEANIPSTNKPVTFRQMLVRDEKILLIAKASEDDNDIYRAVKQVVNNCIFDVDVDNLTTFDIEWLFLKIRSASIGSVVTLTYLDREDEEEYSFNVDLETVVINWPEFTEGNGSLVKIDENTAMQMRYPPSSLLDDEEALEGDHAYEYIASRCIQKIFDGDETYVAEDYTKEELVTYILDLDTKSYGKVKDFIASTPHLFYEIEYQNKMGTERKITLTTLTDFFTLR